MFSRDTLDSFMDKAQMSDYRNKGVKTCNQDRHKRERRKMSKSMSYVKEKS